MELDRLDHLVLTVRDINATCAFYAKALGMERREFGVGRVALHFGHQKINLHPIENNIDLRATVPMPGSADLCFIARTPLAQVVEHLRVAGIALLAEPSRRSGALGPIQSVYFRDPDGNLIEVSNYAGPAAF